MIKGIAIATKKPDISEADFHRHWRKTHAPLALEMKSLRRYVQSHRSSYEIPGFEACPVDGVAEIWFDDLQTMLNLPNDPDYINGAQADEPNFVDMSTLHFLATTEHVFIEGPGIEKDTSSIKAIFLLQRRTGMDVRDFQDYWKNEHAVQIPTDAGIVRYVQCHTVAETYAATTPAYDGVAELSFENFQAFEAYWNSDRIQAIFAADAPKFLHPENCTAFLAEENRVLWP